MKHHESHEITTIITNEVLLCPRRAGLLKRRNGWALRVNGPASSWRHEWGAPQTPRLPPERVQGPGAWWMGVIRAGSSLAVDQGAVARETSMLPGAAGRSGGRPRWAPDRPSGRAVRRLDGDRGRNAATSERACQASSAPEKARPARAPAFAAPQVATGFAQAGRDEQDRSTVWLAALVVTLMTCLTHAVHAADWPRFLNANIDGISSESIATSWPVSGPKVLWRANVGTGFASIAVADGRTFTLGHRDGKETVYCFNATTGKVVWSHRYDCPLHPNLHEGGPSATPTVDGDRVYTLSKDGDLFCFNVADGKVVWQTDLKRDLSMETPQWGFSASPLILGDALILQAGHTVAYDKATGRIRWKSERAKPAYGSAVPIQLKEFGGGSGVVVLNTDGLAVYDATDGRTLATTPWQTRFSTNGTSPIVVGHEVCVSTGYGQGCGLFRVNGSSLQNVYTNTDMANHMANCVLIDGHLFGYNGNAHPRSTKVELVCMEWSTGQVKWAERGLGCGTVIAAGKTLVLLSDKGELVLAPATPTGFKPTARAQVLGGKCWTPPALADGRVYCRNAAGDVVCVAVGK